MEKAQNPTDQYIMRCLAAGKVKVDFRKGRVISVNKNRPYKVMHRNPSGYCYLDFKFFKERRSVSPSRVIWIAKHGIIPVGYEIHHIDRNIRNNKLENLQCLSKEEHDKIHDRGGCTNETDRA